MKELEGGRAGQIWRDGNTVVRPSGPWTPTVHRFLRYLQNSGFYAAPIPVELTQYQETVSYVEGRVCEHLADRFVGSERMLHSAGELLRKFHSASRGFLNVDREVQTWVLPPQEPSEIVCHGDFAPYNVATEGDVAVGIIDFDTAHPAPPLWHMRFIDGRHCLILPTKALCSISLSRRSALVYFVPPTALRSTKSSGLSSDTGN